MVSGKKGWKQRQDLLPKRKVLTRADEDRDELFVLSKKGNINISEFFFFFGTLLLASFRENWRVGTGKEFEDELRVGSIQMTIRPPPAVISLSPSLVRTISVIFPIIG